MSAVATSYHFEAIIRHTFFPWPFLRSVNSKIWFRPTICENANLKKAYGKNDSNIRDSTGREAVAGYSAEEIRLIIYPCCGSGMEKSLVPGRTSEHHS